MTWWMWTLASVTYAVIGLFAARHEYVGDVKYNRRLAEFEGPLYFFVGVFWPVLLVFRLMIIPIVNKIIDLGLWFFDAPLRKHRAAIAERKQAIEFWTGEWQKAEPGSPEDEVASTALESFDAKPPADMALRRKRGYYKPSPPVTGERLERVQTSDGHQALKIHKATQKRRHYVDQAYADGGVVMPPVISPTQQSRSNQEALDRVLRLHNQDEEKP